MNIVEFKLKNNAANIAFCFVDRTNDINSSWAKEIIKNIADFTISNLYNKGFDLFQGLDENILLNHVAELEYTHAVVFSTGTEFINGDSFFENLRDLVNQQFFLCGHVLDRKDAYYELHHQCYVINLGIYKRIGNPIIGEQLLGFEHTEIEPKRSQENYHDDYTPRTVRKGKKTKLYNHACHGWNILKVGFENNLPILSFDEKFRESKKYHYPESDNDFNKSSQWIYYRERYCSTEMVHTHNTEVSNDCFEFVDTIITPASGTSWFNWLDPSVPSEIIFYDYNRSALHHWKLAAPKRKHTKYKFCYIDLLGTTQGLSDLVDEVIDKKLMINLSNIFCYEGTAALSPLTYRLYKENQIIQMIKNKNHNICMNFTSRAATGFTEVKLSGKAQDFELVNINSIKKPTWHFNQDWI